MAEMPLRWKMLLALFLCWLLPLLCTTVITLFVTSSNINQQIEKTVEISVDKAIDISHMNIQDSIASSRNASYLLNVKEAYRSYQVTGNNLELYTLTTDFLHQQYRYNENFISTIIYYYDNPSVLHYTYYNSNNANYMNSIIQFETYAYEGIQEELDTLGTATKFVVENGCLYMIRNMVDAQDGFQEYAAIVMDINEEAIFGSVTEIWNYQDCIIYVNKEHVMGSQDDERMEALLNTDGSKSEYVKTDNELYFIRTDYVEGQRIDYLITLDPDIFISAKGAIDTILFVWVMLMLPLITMIFYFFLHFVTKPVHTLVKAVGKIEEEEYGYQIEEDIYRQEFKYLAIAFNKMSRKLQKQFEERYLEELALKDAKISALQSQINPHFLNNTLEIINWEARMTDNYKVSEMIESLSVMLEATTNRSGDRLIPLVEELNYVEAYLFIIAQRFGKKLKVTKDIDQSLYQCKVPKLIIQPIIENAVEHGMNIQRLATIELKIYAIENRMYIQIRDNGTLTEEDKQKIQTLLSDGGSDQKQPQTSIGIRNVNSRLKIIYGETYNLTIKSDEENHTVSTIVVKIDT